MRAVISLLFFCIGIHLFAQFNEFSDKAISQNKVKACTLTIKNQYDRIFNKKFSSMNVRQYSPGGKLELEYIYNGYYEGMKDSSLYTYDASGKLIQKQCCLVYSRRAKEQTTGTKANEPDIDTMDTFITIYMLSYNEKNQLIKNETKSNEKLIIRKELYYDSLGRLQKEEERHFKPSPEEYNEDILYTYNEEGQLINKKTIHITNKQTEEIRYEYDKKGNTVQIEVLNTLLGNSITLSKYKGSKLAESMKTETSGTNQGKTYTCTYSYNGKGNMKEKKEYKGGTFYRWVKYIYNDKNMLAEELTLFNMKEPATSSSSDTYEYSYY